MNKETIIKLFDAVYDCNLTPNKFLIQDVFIKDLKKGILIVDSSETSKEDIIAFYECLHSSPPIEVLWTSEGQTNENEVFDLIKNLRTNNNES